MPSKAKVTLLGHLARDPEVRYTQKGTQMLTLSVGVNDGRRGQNGEFEDHTSWYRVSWFGGEGVNRIAERLQKGTLVFITGRLATSTFVGRDNKTFVNLDVTADDVTIAERRSEDEGQSGGESANAGQAVRMAPPAKTSSQSGPDLEDLPF